MKPLLYLVIAGGIAACHSGGSDRPTPEAKRGMDSALTTVADSGARPDSTVSDTTPGDSTAPR